MEYAVIETGGKQYRVNPGMSLEIDKISGENAKGELIFDKVLLYVNGSEVNLGTPYLNDIAVAAKFINHIKGEKIRVARFKAKSRYRKVKGFRASLTQVQIEKIVKSPKKETKPKSK